MPTAKPRITITLTEQQHHVLQSLSDLQGESMSGIVVDLLETALPVLERVGAILQAAKDAPASAKQKLRESLDMAEAGMLPMASGLINQLDLLTEVAGGGATGTAAPPRATKPAAKKGKPPSTNRGVRNTQNPIPKSPKGPYKTGTSKKSAGGAKK